MKKPELLLPAGSLERLKSAFLYGADAVYAGLPSVSLRAKSEFNTETLAMGIDYAHQIGKKVYLTLNLFTHNKDIDRLKEAVNMLKILKPDGVIVADPGVFDYLKNQCPNIPLHISTQANVCSYLTVDFWKKQGASLCVLGREVPASEMAEIRNKCPDIKLEAFIHGAMCISYSGRCLMSNFMTGRSANKGNCAHSCRWNYKVYIEEEKRPNQLMEWQEDERGSYLMNSRDLCLLPRLPELLKIGLDSFKIEGRNKSEYYVSVIARTYRKAIDDYFNNPATWTADKYIPELSTLQNRGYTVGFFDGNAGPESINYDFSGSTGDWRYAGIIREIKDDGFILEIKNKLSLGDTIEILSPKEFSPIRLEIKDFFDTKNNMPITTMSCGFLGQCVHIKANKDILSKIEPLTVCRIKVA